MPLSPSALLERDQDTKRITPCEGCYDVEVEPGSPADLAHAATCQFNKELVRVLSAIDGAEAVLV